MKQDKFRLFVYRKLVTISIPVIVLIGLCINILYFTQQFKLRLRILISEMSVGQYYVSTRMNDNTSQLESCANAFCNILSEGNLKIVQIYDQDINMIGNSYNKDYAATSDILVAASGASSYQYFLRGPFVCLSISSPISKNNEIIGVIRYIHDYSGLFLKSTVILWVFLCFIIFIILHFLSTIVSEHISQPIEAIHKTIKNLETENFPSIDIIELRDIVKKISHIQVEKKLYVDKLNNERERQSLFFSGATHQLKTPLTSIIGYSQMIDQISNDIVVLECGEYIQEAGKDLLNMVERMLNISRYRHSDYEFAPQWFKLYDLVEICRHIVSPRLKIGDISLVNRCSNEIIYFDKDSVKEVLLNILDNAIRHSLCKKIVITTGTVPVRMIIEDDGVGIDSGRLSKIFEPFYRSKGSLNIGSGLGLAICREMMRGQGGDIIAESVVDNGTKFILYFEDREKSHRLIGNMSRRI